MNKKEAIRNMLHGEKVCCETFDKGSYVFFDEGMFMDEDGSSIEINEYSDGGDWKIYEPPVQKIKMWMFVMQYGNSKPVLSIEFHKSAQEVPCGDNGRIIQRADWTEIEALEVKN